jgi:hypothetical protein
MGNVNVARKSSSFEFSLEMHLSSCTVKAYIAISLRAAQSIHQSLLHPLLLPALLLCPSVHCACLHTQVVRTLYMPGDFFAATGSAHLLHPCRIRILICFFVETVYQTVFTIVRS